eukprot:252027_1
MSSDSTQSAPRKIRRESWLETQDPNNKTVWTRDWVVCTATAVHIYENYKCYKDAKKIINGTEMLSILDNELDRNLLGIKTNTETVIFRFIGYQQLNSWRYQLEQCQSCISIPISVQCTNDKHYNCNFTLSISHSGYSVGEIIKDIIFHLENIYDTLEFFAKTIKSNSYCDNTIDCNSAEFNDWQYMKEFQPSKFTKENVVKKGVILTVDIADKKQEEKIEKVQKKTKKKINKKKEKQLKWLSENRHNEILWDKLRNTDSSERRRLKWLWHEQRTVDTTLQSKYLKENENRIKELLEKVNNTEKTSDIYLADKLFQILNDCILIKQNRIHEEILRIIVRFNIGNSLMPIYYTLSYLPFFDPIIIGSRGTKGYYDTLKIWWNEVRLSANHWGMFQPVHIQSAATEFAQFLDTQFTKGGPSLKYYLVPGMKMDKMFNLWNDDPLSFQLGNQYCKCLGGIQLFQRVYLEASVEGLYGIGNSFVVDLQNIYESHGDNWCFDGNGNVLMADNSYKRICNLKVGDKVRSFPNFVSTIKCCIQSNINDEIEMVKLQNNCWITFEHPILIKTNDYNGGYDTLNRLDTDEIKKYGLLWVLPKQILPVKLRYQDKIYNFMLDSYHTINVNGNWCCTLGHDYKGKI